MSLNWHNPNNIGAQSFVCGYCEVKVGGSQGYFANATQAANTQGRVYICPNCTAPSYFLIKADPSNGKLQVQMQEPSPAFGQRVTGLSADSESVYDEARRSMKVKAFMGVVMLCRKLLMHVAVDLGASPGESFAHYIDYLIEHGHVAPRSRDWVDSIRTIGNEANHEVKARTEREAKTLVEFSEMLLKTIYEYPARACDS